jgi:hypothetical protein
MIDYGVKWRLSRPRERCADCGANELHDEGRRLIIEVLTCTACGRRVCKRCHFRHLIDGHKEKA